MYLPRKVKGALLDLGHLPMPRRGPSLLSGLATAVLLVAILRWGQPVLLPIAVAGVLAFILSAPVRWLQRHLSPVVALGLVMLLSVSVAGAAGWVLVTQLDELTARATGYSEALRRKVAALEGTSGGQLARLEALVTRATESLERRAGPGSQAVHLVAVRRSPAAHLWELVRPLAQPLLTTLFVLVLCVFMLGQRDDLRNRLIRLVGPGHVTSTTRTLDDGGQRITRYLQVQTVINGLFGLVVGAGLYLVGIPYAALWGSVAAVARFVPYLGAASSMLPPAALAFALFPGWGPLVLTVVLFLGMDLATAYAVEPLLIGRRTGVSSIALLVSALFWAWLWGPVGLALSAPLTVSLSVLGRHVPDLEFLAVLLGDGQVIGREISFYQRLLARDEDEAGELAQAQQAALGPTGVLDALVIPTLVLAAGDLARREITADDEAFIVTWSRDIFLHLRKAAPAAAPEAPCRVLGVAAHGGGSTLLLEMLAAELPAGHGPMEILAPASTPAEVLARVAHLAPAVVCVAALPPEGGPYARQLCHLLDGRAPDATLVAFRPGEPGIDPGPATRRLREAGADLVVATLAEASAALAHLLAGDGGPSGTAPSDPSA